MFRPFVIFRGKWRRDIKVTRQEGSAMYLNEKEDSVSNLHPELPAWLHECCERAINAALATIYYFCEVSAFDTHVKVRHILTRLKELSQ